MRIPSSILLIITISMSCNNQDATLKELDELTQEATAIHCQLERMKDTISIKWDDVNQTLEDNLPESMPEEEKTNMLNVRNASLIRMFQSYKDLDSSIHNQVNETEKKDQFMAKRITEKRKELMAIEKEKNAILLDIKSKNKKFDVTKYYLNYDDYSINCK